MKTTNLLLIVLTLTGITAFCVGCSDDDGKGSSNGNAKTITLNAGQQQAAKSLSDFGWDFYKEVHDDINHADDNIVASPLSMSYALALTANGANGTTRSEILQALDIDEADIDVLNSYFKTIYNEMPSLSPNCKLLIANSIWANSDHGFEFIDPFKELAFSSYYAEDKSTTDKKYVADVNEWCSEKTNKLIPQFLAEGAKPQPFTIINALYFNAKWHEPFSKSEIRQQDFHNIDGSVTHVDFLKKTTIKKYMEGTTFRLLEYPYDGNTFSFYVLLPDEDENLDAVFAEVKDSGWSSIKSQLRPRNLAISLPKFKSEYRISAGPSLEHLGIIQLFGSPDLSNMTDSRISNIGILQKCVLSIDERGAEGAAVTGIHGETSPGAPESPIAFDVDRPFIYLIEENSTGTIVFIGQQVKF